MREVRREEVKGEARGEMGGGRGEVKENMIR